MLLAIAGPDDIVRFEWLCSPQASICDLLLEFLANISATPEEIVIPQTLFSSSVLEPTADSDASSVEVILTAKAMREFQGQTSAINTVTFVFSTAENPEVSAKEGIREWHLLSGNLELEAAISSCKKIDRVLVMTWSWRKVGDVPWKTIPGQTRSLMQMPIVDLDGQGTYEFRVELAGENSADFLVQINGMPSPIAALSLPSRASAGCDMVVDASASYDPGEGELAFKWDCDAAEDEAATTESVNACKFSVNSSTAVSVSIPGGTLDIGTYDFTINLVRPSDGKTAEANARVNVESSSRPAVSFGTIANKVSPQKQMEVKANIANSAGCQAPPWQAWWLTRVIDGEIDNTSAKLVSDVEWQTGGSAVAVVQPPLLAPGVYTFRLILASDKASTTWNPGDGAYAFDSQHFLVDTPPKDGLCRLHPLNGEIILTRFSLRSMYWVDEDIPLTHRFSWRMEPKDADTGTAWIPLGSWSVNGEMAGFSVGKLGKFTTRAFARDTLGSVSNADAEGETTPLPSTFSDADVGDVLSDAAAGSSFVALSMVSAVAGSPYGSSGTMTTAMLDTVELALPNFENQEPTAELVEASVGVLDDILVSAVGSTGNANDDVKLNAAVTGQATSVLSNLATATTKLSSGLDVASATTFVKSIGTLMTSVSSLSPSPTASAEDAQKNDVAKTFSSQLLDATNKISDAILTGTPVGQEVSIIGDSMKLSLRKESEDTIKQQGAVVDAVQFPPLPETIFESGRRLSTCDSSKGVGLHFTSWSTNPYAYAGNTSFSNIGLPSEVVPRSHDRWKVTVDKGEWWALEETSVISINMRMCGRTLEVSNLKENITFPLRVPRDRDDTPHSKTLRICQYFDVVAERWNDRGCIVQNSTGDDEVICSCSHLTDFTGASLQFEIFEEAVAGLCVSPNVLSFSTFSIIGTGSWAWHRSAIAFFVFLGFLALVSLVCAFRSQQLQATLNISRSKFLHASVVTEMQPNSGVVQASWRRIEIAAQKAGRKRIVAFALWQIKMYLVGPCADLEESLIKSPVVSTATLFLVGGIRKLAACEIGVTARDGMMLHSLHQLPVTVSPEHIKPNADTDEVSRVSRSLEVYIEDIKRQVKGEAIVGTSLVTLLQMVHPAFQLAKASIVDGTAFNILNFMMTIVGAFMFYGILLQRSSVDPESGGWPECEELEVDHWIVHDVVLALISVLLGVGPPWLLMNVHRRRMDVCDVDQRRAAIGSRAWKDMIVFVVGLLWMFLCIVLSMSFLAAVRPFDRDRWLLGAALIVLKAWVLDPILTLCCWYFLVAVGQNNLRMNWQIEVVLSVLNARAKVAKTTNQGQVQPADAMSGWMGSWLGLMQRDQAEDERPLPPPPLPPPIPLPPEVPSCLQIDEAPPNIPEAMPPSGSGTAVVVPLVFPPPKDTDNEVSYAQAEGVHSYLPSVPEDHTLLRRNCEMQMKSLHPESPSVPPPPPRIFNRMPPPSLPPLPPLPTGSPGPPPISLLNEVHWAPYDISDLGPPTTPPS